MSAQISRKYLTLDNGGTNTKALLFDDGGRLLAQSSFPTAWIQPAPGMREIDVYALRESLFQAIRDVLGQASLTGNDIDCITCVGHGKGLYVLDRHGRIGRHGIMSTDNRAKDLAVSFERRIEEIYPLSAQHVMPGQAPVLLRWLKDHEPESYATIGSVLSAKDFVRFLLSGDIHQEIGDASGNNLVNLHTRNYDGRLFDFFGIQEMRDCMPDLVESDSIVSRVSQEAAQVTGLRAMTPITGGLFDIDAGTLGMGVLDDSKFAIIAGTWNINVYPAAQPCAPAPGIMNSLFCNHQTLIEASSPTSAGNLDIILPLLIPDRIAQCKAEGISIYAALEEMLSSSLASPSAVVFFPFLYGSNSDPYATGSFLGLDSTTTRDQLITAVYEGIAFAHRQHVEQLQATRQSRPCAMRISGGASNSPAWMQLFSNILNASVQTLQQQESSGLGGAIVSATATHRYESLSEAARCMVGIAHSYEPDVQAVRRYEHKYRMYRNMLSALEGHWGSGMQTTNQHHNHENEVQ